MGKLTGRPLAAAAIVLLIDMLAGGPPSALASAERECLRQLERGRGAEIVCELPTRLTDQERAELRRLTRDVVQDARCIVSIRIERRDLDEALRAPEHVFEAPPQPARCEIATRDRAIMITGTFAPRVVFADGRAVEATPGLANVEGVSALLAWPVVQYVNGAGTIQEGMLTAINAWRGYLTAKR